MSNYDTLLSVMTEHGLHIEYLKTTVGGVSAKLMDVPGERKVDTPSWTPVSFYKVLLSLAINTLENRKAQLSGYAQVSAAHSDTLARFSLQIRRIEDGLKTLRGLSDDPA